MSYTYLLEQGEESSAASFSDIPQSVLSRLNLIAGKSYSKGNATESCQSSQSGMMSPPSTELHGEEKSMSSAEDSLARIFQSQTQKAEVWMVNEADYGVKCKESLAKYDHASSSWKTAQCLLFGGGVRVIEDFAKLGYDCRWGIVGSHHTDSPMRRDRMWILASNCGFRREAPWKRKVDCELKGKKKSKWQITTNRENNLRLLRERYSDEILSRNFRGCDALADRMDRLTAIGNGQDAVVAATAWRILGGKLK